MTQGELGHPRQVFVLNVSYEVRLFMCLAFGFLFFKLTKRAMQGRQEG